MKSRPYPIGPGGFEPIATSTGKAPSSEKPCALFVQTSTDGQSPADLAHILEAWPTSPTTSDARFECRGFIDSDQRLPNDGHEPNEAPTAAR